MDIKKERIIQVRRQKRTGDAREWVDVAKSVDVMEGTVVRVSGDPYAIILIRSEGRLYALDAECPHSGGPLHKGSVCDGAIRCPTHGYEFELSTGRGRGNDHIVSVRDVREIEMPDMDDNI